jgi:hypothetical protein
LAAWLFAARDQFARQDREVSVSSLKNSFPSIEMFRYNRLSPRSIKKYFIVQLNVQ